MDGKGGHIKEVGGDGERKEGKRVAMRRGEMKDERGRWERRVMKEEWVDDSEEEGEGEENESVGVMKPDIVFFGEGLPDDFHHALEEDKTKVSHCNKSAGERSWHSTSGIMKLLTESTNVLSMSLPIYTWLTDSLELFAGGPDGVFSQSEASGPHTQ